VQSGGYKSWWFSRLHHDEKRRSDPTDFSTDFSTDLIMVGERVLSVRDEAQFPDLYDLHGSLGESSRCSKGWTRLECNTGILSLHRPLDRDLRQRSARIFDAHTEGVARADVDSCDIDFAGALTLYIEGCTRVICADTSHTKDICLRPTDLKMDIRCIWLLTLFFFRIRKRVVSNT
jgi:hypothetical protein